MAKLLLAPETERDLVEIYEYIAEDNVLAAERMLEKIENALTSLTVFPLRGRERAEFHPGLRSIAIKPYVIFYSFRDDTVYIVRILSGYRDLKEELQ